MQNIVLWFGILLLVILAGDIIYLWIKNKNEEKKTAARLEEEK